MSKQSVLNSPRLKELRRHRRLVFFGKFFLVFTVVLAALGGIVYLSRLDQLNILEIRIGGNSVVDKTEIEEVIKKEIAGYYFWIFPRSNVFLYPKNTIRSELKNKFKIFKVVNLSIVENQVLKADVFEREGLYTWCGTDLVSTNENACYFLDENGFIFGEAPYFSGEVYFKFYAPIESRGETIGASILPGNFEKLIVLKDTLSNIGLKPASLYTNDGKEIKIYLSNGKPGQLGPEIIFMADADLDNLAANLETALSTEPLLTNFKKKYSSLEYIDLRFGNKVYYKFR